jgi:hypothetical protein
MKTIEQVEKFDDKKFQKTFGVNRKTFNVMLEILQTQFENAHKKGGRKPKVSIFDRLCIFFAYYRDRRTIADIANEYNLAESTTFDILSLVEKTLLSDSRFHLPSKRELIEGRFEIVMIDATEVPILRPKKNKESTIPAKRKDTP